jgi:hypothetical protein
MWDDEERFHCVLRRSSHHHILTPKRNNSLQITVPSTLKTLSTPEHESIVTVEQLFELPALLVHR